MDRDALGCCAHCGVAWVTTMATPDVVTRILRAVEDRVSLNEQRLALGGSIIGEKKMRVRLNESTEILGILRNVVKAAQ